MDSLKARQAIEAGGAVFRYRNISRSRPLFNNGDLIEFKGTGEGVRGWPYLVKLVKDEHFINRRISVFWEDIELVSPLESLAAQAE